MWILSNGIIGIFKQFGVNYYVIICKSEQVPTKDLLSGIDVMCHLNTHVHLMPITADKTDD